MDCDNDWVLASVSVEYSGRKLANVEPKVSEGTCEGIVPFLPGLLQAIQRFLEVLDSTLVAVIAGQVLHVDVLLLIELPVEVRPVEVEGVEFVVLLCSKR